MGASIVEALLLACFFGFLQIGVFLLIPFTIAWSAWHQPYVALPAIFLYAFTFLDGAEKSSKRSRAWPAFSRKFWLFKFMREYFPQRVHIPESFPLAKSTTASGEQQYMFALHPHGSFSEFRILLDGQLLELLPGLGGRQICWLAASVLFRLPVVRELCLWTGCVDAGRKTAEKMLKAGHCVGVIPGGEHEQLLTTYGEDIVYLKKRFGFIKLALRFNVPVVPCYVFGVSDLHYTTKFLLSLRLSLVKNLGIAIPLSCGSYGLPTAPLKTPVNIVVGDPIDLRKELNLAEGAEPTEEEVGKALSKYTDTLQTLFDANKSRFGYERRNLKIE